MQINKVTKLYSPIISQQGNEHVIQAHIDEMNAQGWSLLSVESLKSWYRFFWYKEQV